MRLQFESKSSRAKGIAFHPDRSVTYTSPRTIFFADFIQTMDPRITALFNNSTMGLPDGHTD